LVACRRVLQLAAAADEALDVFERPYAHAAFRRLPYEEALGASWAHAAPLQRAQARRPLGLLPPSGRDPTPLPRMSAYTVAISSADSSTNTRLPEFANPPRTTKPCAAS
jgi:hypothetical protein